MWVSSEPSRKIQLSGSGKLTKGVKASAITPAMLMIRVMLTSASSPNLTSTFQAACITAASRTSRVHPRERVTRESDRRQKASENRSEEHTSELQSRLHLVCRLLLEKKKQK